MSLTEASLAFPMLGKKTNGKSEIFYSPIYASKVVLEKFAECNFRLAYGWHSSMLRLDFDTMLAMLIHRPFCAKHCRD